MNTASPSPTATRLSGTVTNAPEAVTASAAKAITARPCRSANRPATAEHAPPAAYARNTREARPGGSASRNATTLNSETNADTPSTATAYSASNTGSVNAERKPASRRDVGLPAGRYAAVTRAQASANPATTASAPRQPIQSVPIPATSRPIMPPALLPAINAPIAAPIAAASSARNAMATAGMPAVATPCSTRSPRNAG
ncbi:hypothetical protein GCM10010492_10770 [Saccharothrix mutabilis subsp. mutabilis]|uniref:Uncharacterized protein n=1 Tax=Saccharothrix mutabilis subsp. mutabilis TaxID=66855 RepID=A0ABN0T7W7_9PSEU